MRQKFNHKLLAWKNTTGDLLLLLFFFFHFAALLSCRHVSTRCFVVQQTSGAAGSMSVLYFNRCRFAQSHCTPRHYSSVLVYSLETSPCFLPLHYCCYTWYWRGCKHILWSYDGLSAFISQVQALVHLWIILTHFFPVGSTEKCFPLSLKYTLFFRAVQLHTCQPLQFFLAAL